MLLQLTPREQEVLALLAEGLDNHATAERLFISPDTARAHVVKVLAKLQIESRLQAAIFAFSTASGHPLDVYCPTASRGCCSRQLGK